MNQVNEAESKSNSVCSWSLRSPSAGAVLSTLVFLRVRFRLSRALGMQFAVGGAGYERLNAAQNIDQICLQDGFCL